MSTRNGQSCKPRAAAWLVPVCGVGPAEVRSKPVFSKGQCSPLRTCSGDLFFSFFNNHRNYFDEKERKLSETCTCQPVFH